MPFELEVFKTAETAAKQEQWKYTEEALLQIRDLAKNKNTSLMLLLIPDRFQVDDAYWKQWVVKYRLKETDFDRDAPNKHLAEFAQAHGIPFADATGALREQTHRRKPVYWIIDNHLNAYGHEVVSRVLEEALQKAAA
jgi:hypothetical protein